jgi:hypothetical protein
MQIVPIKQSPVGQILYLRKVHGVTVVVTNIELVVVHIFRFLNHPLKELPAGEGLTLFGWVATPDLAGFHNIKLILLCKLK